MRVNNLKSDLAYRRLQLSDQLGIWSLYNSRLSQDIAEFIVYLYKIFTREVAPLIFVRHSINVHSKTQINSSQI